MCVFVGVGGGGVRSCLTNESVDDTLEISLRYKLWNHARGERGSLCALGECSAKTARVKNNHGSIVN